MQVFEIIGVADQLKALSEKPTSESGEFVALVAEPNTPLIVIRQVRLPVEEG